MAQNYYGSICITDILDNAKNLHPSFSKGKNGKIYLNVTAWVNDEVDQYGNHASIKISDKDDTKGAYIGNLKKGEKKDTPITKSDLEEIASITDDLPF